MKKNKTLYRILIILGFIFINAAVVYGLSQVYAYLNTGADPSSMLHLDLKRTTYYTPDVTWVSIENPGRPLDEANKQKIEQDYLDAWYVKNQAFETGNDQGVYDHYTEKARAKVRELINLNQAEQIKIKSTTLSHNITLDFYSDDGTVAILTDRNVTGVEKIYEKDEFILQRDFNNDYHIILLLEDGFWRIRHFEKLTANDIESSIAEILTVNTTVIEVINYYPKDTPWDTFGENFNETIIEEDFEIINDLKLNTIRVFVGYEDFGKASVAKAKLEKLQILLEKAEKANLKVMLTLFDFYGNYDIQDWTLTNKHLSTVVNTVKDYKALASWDIKNEPNLDFENRGEQRVVSWLSQTLKKLKQLDPNHPVTIGWSSPEAALILEDEVDYVSYHFYKDLDGLSEAHNKIKKSTSKPIILQEMGLSTYHGLWNPLGSNEDDQAAYYTQFLEIQKRDSINYLSWTLFDFGEIPNSVAGFYPWRKHKQAYFGLIDFVGAKSKSYSIIKNR